MIDPTPFSQQDLDLAMDRLSMLDFWPSDPRTQAQIQALLIAKVPHREALVWLVEQFVEVVGKWHGPAELLGVLDTRYRPLDGKSYWSTLPGYTGADGEMRTIADTPQEQQALTGEAADMLRQLSERMDSLRLYGDRIPRIPPASEREEAEREAQ